MSGFFSVKETQSLSRPNGKPHTCISCGAFKTSITPKMQPHGNFKKGIMNIGEFPDLVDDQRGMPFQGKQGKVLQKYYKELGIDLFEDCINLNAINCCPTDDKGELRDPSGTELDTCRKSVLSYIKKYKPKVIVLFGMSAVYSVIGNRWKDDMGTIEKWRGWTIPDQELKAWLIPMFSIKLLSQERQEVETVWRQDFANIKIKLKEPLLTYPDPVIEVVDEEQWNCLDRIQDGVVAFDYETTGLKPHSKGHRIVCMSVADSADHVFVGMMPVQQIFRKPFKDLMKRSKVGKMSHNMKFEDTWTNVRLKTVVDRWHWDSMIAAHILDNRKGVTGLKFQSYVQFGVSDYSSEISPYLRAVDDDNANSINRIDELLLKPGGQEKLLKYCALDSIYEYRLAVIQQSIIHQLPF